MTSDESYFRNASWYSEWSSTEQGRACDQEYEKKLAEWQETDEIKEMNKEHSKKFAEWQVYTPVENR